MTQDQFGQTRGHGYVPGDETGENPKMTRLQKVASAILGDRPDRDEADQGQPPPDQVTGSSAAAAGSDTMEANPDAPAADPPYVTEQDEAAMANSPIAREAQGAGGTAATAGPAVTGAGDAAGAGAASPRRDYWDDTAPPEADGTEAADVTRPDGPPRHPAARASAATGQAAPVTTDPSATQPDMFGTANGTTTVPSAEGQSGATAIADVPAGGTPGGAGPGGAGPGGAGPGGAGPSGAGPGSAGPGDAGPGDAGPVKGAPADGALRPGQVTAALGDFSDLTYGNLIPDAAHYTEQWQQIQFKFVDDPQASVTEAADIIAQVTTKMEAAIQERQRAIEERQRAIAEQQRSLRGRWGEGSNADTEALRETLQMYKAFLDQLIGSRAS
jgi:hypothetical protein